MKTAAVDIETTGTEPDDQITVIGVDIPMGSRLFLNTDGREYSDAIGQALDEEFAGVVSVTACSSEHSMLSTFQKFALRRFGRANQDETDEFKFAAYNGETWHGGFDLPFIRTRCREHDVEWPLQGPYIDVMTVVGDHFNVSGKGLETTYGELVGEGLNERDPFADSGAAVQSWRDGAFKPLLQHNLVDIRRTRQLVSIAEQYCSSSHFSMRSLNPIDP
jgi:uncharacterized protein YprB with RNaseH-like and TPR domain